MSDDQLAVVPPGPQFVRRLAHGGLYADAVVAFAPAGVRVETLDLLRLPTLLRWLWEIREPTRERWLVVVDPSGVDPLSTIGMILDEEGVSPAADLTAVDHLYWAVLVSELTGVPRCMPVPPAVTDSWLARLRRGLKQPHNWPHAGPLHEIVSQRLDGLSSAVLENAWFGELLISLGRYTDHLDGGSVCALRREGVREVLRDWLDTYVSRVALAMESGRDPAPEIKAAQRQLSVVAEVTDRALSSARSAFIRARLKQTAVWEPRVQPQGGSEQI